MKEDRTVESYDIFSFLNEGFPPQIFNIFLEGDAIGTKGVGVGKSAINFRSGIDKTAPLTEGDDRLEGVLRLHTAHFNEVAYCITCYSGSMADPFFSLIILGRGALHLLSVTIDAVKSQKE